MDNNTDARNKKIWARLFMQGTNNDVAFYKGVFIFLF